MTFSTGATPQASQFLAAWNAKKFATWWFLDFGVPLFLALELGGITKLLDWVATIPIICQCLLSFHWCIFGTSTCLVPAFAAIMPSTEVHTAHD